MGGVTTGKFLWQSFYKYLNLNLFNSGNQLLEAETSLDAAMMSAAFMGNVYVFSIWGLGC